MKFVLLCMSILPFCSNLGLVDQEFKRVKFDRGKKPAGIETGHIKYKTAGKINENDDDDDDKPHLIPLSFVADTGVDAVDFNPEKSGLLLHEYYDAIYKKYPQYKKVVDLRNEVLQRDPLVEKLNPYSDEIAISRYAQTFTGLNNDNVNGVNDMMNNLLQPPKSRKLDPRFELDPAEKEEFTRPTIPPFTDLMQPGDYTDDSDEEGLNELQLGENENKEDNVNDNDEEDVFNEDVFFN